MKCVWCKCLPESHLYYIKCPMLDDWICDICCMYDSYHVDPETGKLEIVKVVKNVTGKEITNEDVFEFCKNCDKKFVRFKEEKKND